MEEDSFNQTFLTIESTLTKEEYMMMERHFLKEISKTFQFLYKNEIIKKICAMIMKPYVEVFRQNENANLENTERRYGN